MKRIILILLALSVLSFTFICNHENKCKTFHEHKNKIIKKPRNG